MDRYDQRPLQCPKGRVVLALHVDGAEAEP